MAMSNTSILVLFLGSATLLLLVVAEAAGGGPTPMPATAPVVNLCAKTPYQDLCETTVKNKSDPFEALLSNINGTILVTRQAIDLANNEDFERYDIIDTAIEKFERALDYLETSIEYLKAKDDIILQAKLDGVLSALYMCSYEDEMNIPEPLIKIGITLHKMTENSLALSNLLV